MVKCIIIPADAGFPLARTELTSLHDFQTAVGGFVQSISIDVEPVALFADEDGKSKNSPRNRRATCFWWLMRPRMLGWDILVGDVLLVGAPDELGDVTDVPEHIMFLLFDAAGYRVRFRVSRANAWVDHVRRFTDYWDACMFAFDLLNQSSPFAQVRVVPV